MRIIVYTLNPEGLKSRIVSDVENGNLPTWELRTNNIDDKLLTHASEQWADRVLLRLTPDRDSHQLIIEPRHWSNVSKPSDEEYGTVMGRFCERLFAQYASVISSFKGEI